MTPNLVGKVAAITGASNGIGKATALRLAKEGARVAVGYFSDRSGAAQVVQQIGAENAVAIHLDASKIGDISRFVDETIVRFGKIDLLLPCAGMTGLSPLESITEDAFDRLFALNVKGPLFLCQKAAPHMAPGSHIVLFSSTLCAASTVMPPYLCYVASKGAIEQMTRVLSKDFGRKGIAVNCIAPGPTATELFNSIQTEQTLAFLRNANPNGRIGEPDDIADVIAFLCSGDSRWVMGQTLRVNGGMA
ncbi:hypothetical protein BDV12DRAFT_199377 [Aspergillus spectabilis]